VLPKLLDVGRLEKASPLSGYPLSKVVVVSVGVVVDVAVEEAPKVVVVAIGVASERVASLVADAIFDVSESDAGFEFDIGCTVISARLASCWSPISS
jgi:hypothetical protein